MAVKAIVNIYAAKFLQVKANLFKDSFSCFSYNFELCCLNAATSGLFFKESSLFTAFYVLISVFLDGNI